MSFLTLDPFSLAHLVEFLDGFSIARLILTGPALGSKLKRTVRDFRFDWPSELVSPPHCVFPFIRQFSQKPRSFYLNADEIGTQDAPSSIDWDAFSDELESLTISCGTSWLPNDSIPKLDAKLPRLTRLSLSDLCTECRVKEYSNDDSDVFSNLQAPSHFLNSLPPGLTELSIEYAEMKYEPNQPMLDLSHLPLESVELTLYYRTKDAATSLNWSFLPRTIRNMRVNVRKSTGDGSQTMPGPSVPTTFGQLFPHLTSLSVPYLSLLPPEDQWANFNLQLPDSLTAIRAFDNYDKDLVLEPFGQQLSVKYGHNIRSLEVRGAVDEQQKAEYFPLLEKYDMRYIDWGIEPDDHPNRFVQNESNQTKFREVADRYLFKPKRVTTLLLPFLPSPSQLRRLPHSLTDMSVHISLAHTMDDKDSIFHIEPSDWPPAMKTLRLLITYTDQLQPANPPAFDLSRLPSTLTELVISIPESKVDPKFEEQSWRNVRSPHFIGSLAHMSQLTTLSYDPSVDLAKDKRAIVDSLELLPSSLTEVRRVSEGGFSHELFLMPSSDSDTADSVSQHGLDLLRNLRRLILGVDMPQKPFLGQRDAKYLKDLALYNNKCKGLGVHTSCMRRMPPNLTSLAFTPLDSSPKWTIDDFALLPRNLIDLAMPGATKIAFEGDTGEPIYYLPETLTHLDWTDSSYAADELPDDIWDWYLPTITRFNRSTW